MKRGLALLLLIAAPAHAQEGLETTASFWREVREPGWQRSRELVRHGQRLLLEAAETPDPYLRAAHLEGAIERFRRAHALAPRDPEALHLLAHATTRWSRPTPSGRLESHDEEAIAFWEALRALDADYAADEVGFELGILFTKARRFDRAVEEYERALVAVLDPGFAATTHANLAEVHMMAGRLERAAVEYARAIELAERDTSGRSAQALSLALFGAAVALDRLGEHTASLEHAWRARSVMGGSMDVLREDGVFFEPPSEIHWYEALGHLAQAEHAPRDERASAWVEARRSWRRYLALAPEDDPWRELAQRHLREVDRALADAR
ncbi:MAG: hypothetical protein H6721_00455 [Sandaracinus sp.]|nr:hypothetical protein [Myxococcales bacterium]MCB9618533.1 hypothetical protein [Sandaracinus sp.]MCB9622095.1 hypothetical protein [Sandaracinus sp.]MCB9630614.1 hypothetical protein [Sandaracinus sp.]